MNLLNSMTHPALFGKWFSGPSWNNWRTIIKATTALPMSDDERAFFRSVADREPPTKPARTTAYIMGRRAGKDSIASVDVAHAAAFFGSQDKLRIGERALCLSVACDRTQARIQLGMVKAYFSEIEPLRAMVMNETKDGLELNNGVDIVVATNSFRSIRGRSILRAVLSETAFMPADESSLPATELYRAIRPGLTTLAPESAIRLISSPYVKSGLLWDLFSQHYGRDDSDVLIVKAPTLTMHNDPEIAAEREQAFLDDPDAAAAEWDAEWRTDIAALIDPMLIDSCIIRGRAELPYNPSMRAVAFLDAASGVGKDSMVLSIAWFDAVTNKAVLASVREVRPPFSPEQVCLEFSQIARSYGCERILSDRYSLNWIAERFRSHGLQIEYSTKTKSELYRAVLPLISSGRVELLDNPRLRAQLCSLERRVSRGTGHESIDAACGLPEDVANASAGALVYSSEKRGAGSGIIIVGVPHFGSQPDDQPDRCNRNHFVDGEELPELPPKFATC